MSYIFWGFLFGVLIPYMARRFAKFMPATAAYALYRLLWPVKTVSDERKRANPAYQKLMSAYVMRSLGYGIITAAISYAAYWQFGAAHLWWYLESSIGAAAGYVLPVLASLFLVWKHKDVFGGGDIKLLSAAGAWLGVELLLYVILLSCLVFGIYALIRRQRAGAFGPAIAISAIIVAFCFN